jgi:hypothetical protein
MIEIGPNLLAAVQSACALGGGALFLLLTFRLARL